jgi:uncharacterized protein (DUF305 family)
MSFKPSLKIVAFGSALALLPIALAAYSNASNDPVRTHETAHTMAQSMQPSTDASEPQMDHGSMNMNMSLGPKDDSFDLRFIDAMIPHHEGAIVMAQTVLQNSQRPELRQLAQSIIAAQQQEIQQMQAWRKAWYPNASSEPMMYDTEMGHMMPMTDSVKTMMMMKVDLGAADDQFDLRFLDAMIPHHEGAVLMAQQVLQGSDRPELRILAENIISSQQQEINEMQQWRKTWYGQQ